MYNPFGEGTINQVGDSTEDGTPRTDTISLLQELALVRCGERIGERVASATKVVASIFVETGKALFVAVKEIIKQAVKMAMFKFAIEACAMGIKSLVDMMVGMKVTPPNIDTKGVFYNFGTGTSDIPRTSGPLNGAPNQSRYDNPFGNPFGTSSW